MTVKEAATRLGMHPATVHKMVSAGQVVHYRLGPRGGKIDIPESAIESYLESRLKPATPPAAKVKLAKQPVRRPSSAEEDSLWEAALEAAMKA